MLLGIGITLLGIGVVIIIGANIIAARNMKRTLDDPFSMIGMGKKESKFGGFLEDAAQLNSVMSVGGVMAIVGIVMIVISMIAR